MTRTTLRPALFATMFAVALTGALALSAVALRARGENTADTQKLKDTGSCAGCDLTFAQLVHVKAEKGDLQTADVRYANLYGANLRGANLTGAKLYQTSLLHADLSDAVGADLTGAITNGDTICPDKTAGPCK